jgi:hypothetical protein
MDREPLGQALNSVIDQLNATARLAADPATYNEVAAEEGTLWYIKNQCEWLLSYIKVKEETGQTMLKVVK